MVDMYINKLCLTSAALQNADRRTLNPAEELADEMIEESETRSEGRRLKHHLYLIKVAESVQPPKIEKKDIEEIALSWLEVEKEGVRLDFKNYRACELAYVLKLVGEENFKPLLESVYFMGENGGTFDVRGNRSWSTSMAPRA